MQPKNFPNAWNEGQTASSGARQRAVMTSVVLLILLAVSLMSQRSFAQDPTTVRCRVENTTLDVGQTTTLFIEVLNVSQLYGYELRLKYNASRVQFQDADAAKPDVNLAIGTFLKPDFVFSNVADNSKGEVLLVVTQLSPSVAVDGSGELARATLEATRPGIIQFSFADVILSDPTGKAITTRLTGCTLEITGVEETATSTTTATPMATATPTVTTTPATETPTATPTPTTTVPGTGSISGSVFDDINNDGGQSGNEVGIRSLVKLYLSDSERHWSIITAEDGTYAFTLLPLGTYVIEVTPFSGNYFNPRPQIVILNEFSLGAVADFPFNGPSIWNFFLPVAGVRCNCGSVGVGEE